MDLISSLNTLNGTNHSLSRAQRHANYVGDIQGQTCAFVQKLPYELRCEFVRATPDCHDNIYFFTFADLVYCHLQPHVLSIIGGMILFCLVLAYLFLVLALIADGFFCPGLKVVANKMGLSENLAGITLLAFGNGAPDLFTSIAGLSLDSRRLYSDLTGSILFVVYVVGGIIIMNFPFRVNGYLVVRDVLVLLCSLLMLDYVVEDYHVTLVQSFYPLIIYTLYIVVIAIDQVLLLRLSRLQPQKMLSIEEMPVVDILERSRSTSTTRSTVVIEKNFNATENGPNHELFRQFFDNIFQEFETWRQMNRWERVVCILRTPAFICLTLFIPVMDYERPLNNWAKLLNCIQIVLWPTCLVFGLCEYPELHPWGLPLCLFAFVGSLPLAAWFFCVTRTDQPPSWHILYGFLGVIGSIFAIQEVVTIVSNCLEVLGIMSTRSNSYLGTTLLAWGNGIGDLAANYVLARQGYQIMAFTACLGGPIFSSLVIVSFIFIYKAITSPTHSFRELMGTMGPNCFMFLQIGLFLFLGGVLTTNFMIRRSMGVFLLCIYGTFFIATTLGEFEIIHTYGTDHDLDAKADSIDLSDFYFSVQYGKYDE